MAVQQYAENLRIPVQTLAEIAKFLLTCTVIMFVFSLLTVSGIPSESPNIGLVIGIAVGCVAVVLLLTVIAVLIIVCYKKCYQKNQKCQPERDKEISDVSILTPL